MIRITICLFFFTATTAIAQVAGVSEEQLNKEGLYIEAIGHALVQDYEEAMAKMRKFSAQEPTDFAAFYYLAKWSLQTDNLNEGLRLINRAETLAPSQRDVLELKIELLKENYQWMEAAEVAKKIWSLDSLSVQAALRPAQLYIETSEARAASEWLDKVYHQIPLQSSEKKEILELQYDIFMNTGAFDKAVDKAKFMLEIYSDHLPYLYRLAKAYQAQQNLEKEIEVLRRLLALHPEASEAKKRLKFLESKGDLVSYLEQIKPMLSSADFSVRDRVDMLTGGLSSFDVITREERGALYEAARILYEAEPNSQEVQSLYIEAGSYHGRWEEVTKVINTYVRKGEGPMDAVNVLRYLDILVKAHQFNEAAEWGEDLLMLYPNNGELFLKLAFIYWKLDDPEEANYFLRSASRMIRSNSYLEQRAELIKGLLSTSNASSEDFWFSKPFEKIAAGEVDLLNVLFALEHDSISLSDNWLSYISSMPERKESTYLLTLTKAWASYRFGKVEEADSLLEECWNQGCYTQPGAYFLKVQMALSKGDNEKAERFKTELEELGVPWRQN